MHRAALPVLSIFVLLVLPAAALGLAHSLQFGWEGDRLVSASPEGVGRNETAAAANPLDPDNAVVVSKEYGNTVRDIINTTFDGGVTWLEQPFPLADPTLPNYTDPYAFFRDDGRAYIVWTGFRDFYLSGLFTAWSDDGGRTWSAPAAITQPGSYFDDKAWLAFSTSVIYAFWTRFGNAEIYSARSTDGGTTWSAPVGVSSGAYASNNDGAQPVILPDGSIVVIFLHDTADPNTGTMVSARSTDGGATWGPSTSLFSITKPPFRLPGEEWRQFTYHALARDPVSGALTLVWPDYRTGLTNGEEILASRSTDSGMVWSAPMRLNDDPPGVVRDQWFPALSAAPDGRLTALWFSRRDDPNNRRYVAYARTSPDGGASWFPSVRISSASSDPNINIPPDADGIGDYIGLSSGNGVVWASWVDTRSGTQQIYAARELFTPQPLPTPTATATPCTVSFTDVSVSDYFYEGVRYLYCRGAISGYADNSFRPYNSTTRGQVAKIVVLAEGLPINTKGGPHFLDVTASSAFYPYIETAYNRGIVSGYACGTGVLCFRPANNITRGQLCKVIVLAQSWIIDTTGGPHFRDVTQSDPFYTYIETAYNHNVISGYNCGGQAEPCPGLYFRPTAGATRGQIAKIIFNALTGRARTSHEIGGNP